MNNTLVLIELYASIFSLEYCILTYKNVNTKNMLKTLIEKLGGKIYKELTNGINKRAQKKLFYECSIPINLSYFRFVMTREKAILLINKNALKNKNDYDLYTNEIFFLIKPIVNKAGYDILRQEYTECDQCLNNEDHDHDLDDLILRTEFKISRKD